METEKSAAKSIEEKKAMDESGYSELHSDLNVNRQQGDMQNMRRVHQGKKIFAASKKLQKEIFLEKKKK